MKKVIVTGANGFIGSYLVRELIHHDIEVLAIGRPGSSDNLPKSNLVQFLGIDIFEIQKYISELSNQGYDTFFHLAWAGSSGSERTDYELQMKNALNTVECLRTAKQIGCTRFVGAGSIMEREVSTLMTAQGNHPGLGYIYGTGKLAAHCLSKSIAAAERIEFIWGIITNAYGEGERSPRFINTTLRKIIQDEPLQFTSATQNYDFIHVEDVARALRLIGETGKPFYEYVIGSGNAKPLKEFIIEIKNSLAPDKEFCFGNIPFTGINMPEDAFSIEQISADCGFNPEISFTTGIHRTMNWLKEVDIRD